MQNIVIIVVDAFRPKNLSLFGYRKETDANLKRIAKEGVVLKNFISSSNATAPSLMSIFTGRYPDKHGIIHQFPYTKDKEVEKMYQERKFWLPSFLQGKGYETIAVDWLGMFFKDGFDYYKEREEWQGELKTATHFSPAKDTMDLAISKIKTAKKPFFAFIHFWDTHFPFLTTEYKGTLAKNIDEVLSEIKGDEHQKEYYKKKVTVAGNALYSLEGMVEKYDEAIKEVDRQIGKLEQYLKAENLWENTIFMALGDHGTNLVDHNIYFSSCSLFDETIQAPLIAHFPGSEKVDSEDFFQNTDIAPTILGLIGEKQDENFDGRSMVDSKQARNKILFFDGLAEDVWGEITGRKKIIFASNPRCHLCKSSHHRPKEEYDVK